MQIISPSNFTPENESMKIWDKIDEKLHTIIEDPNKQNDIVNLILIYSSDASCFPSLPNGVNIINSFSIISGQLVSTPVSNIIKIAEIERVERIWWDTAVETELNSANFTYIKSANSNANYVNFTGEIGAQEMWKQNYTGSNIVIAVLDTGVDITGSGDGDLDTFHHDDSNNATKFIGAVSMVPQEPLYYSDLNGRGTFHTGIACGTGYLNSSHIGVAPDAYYLNVKVFDSLGITYWSFIISGIEWSISHGADIILFATTIPGLYLDPVSLAVNNAVDRGILVVSPVGDDGPSYMSINTPGQAHKSLTVGAYNSLLHEVANFSSRGPSYDFAVGPKVIAPGVNLIGPRSRIVSEGNINLIQGIFPSEFQSLPAYSYINGMLESGFNQAGNFIDTFPKSQYGEEVPNQENYTKASGTGAAAAVTAGAAAILMSAFPLATPVLIQQALMESAISITTDQDLNVEGTGLINIPAAFAWLDKIFIPNQFDITPTSIPLIYPGIITTSDIRNVSDLAFSSNDLDPYEISAVFSTQAMSSALIVLNSSKNATDQVEQEFTTNSSSIHLPLNQFGLEYTLSDDENKKIFHWFSEFNVIREMHQLINEMIYREGYNRYAGVLEIDGLYAAIIAETWSYCGDYDNPLTEMNITNPFTGENITSEFVPLNIKNRVNAIKFSFRFINHRKDDLEFRNVHLVSYFKADLFLNETGIIETTTTQDQLGSIYNFSLDDTIRFNESNQVVWVEDKNNNTYNINPDNCTAMGFQSFSHSLESYSMGDSINLLVNITLDHLDSSVWNTTNNEFLEFSNKNNSNEDEDPGFALVYRLNNISHGSNTEFTGALGIGQTNSMENSRENLFQQFDLIKNNVTKYNVTDLMVLSSNFSRINENNKKYYSNVKIINIGNMHVNETQISFLVTRKSSDDEYEIYSIIQIVRDLSPFEIRTYIASWVPLEIGVYTMDWAIGELEDTYKYIMQMSGLSQLGNNMVFAENVSLSEANYLSNSLVRPVFVINGSFYEKNKFEDDYFNVFPNKLDQNPMKIYGPFDFAIYNLTIFSIYEMDNITIKTDGLGSNFLSFLNDAPSITEEFTIKSSISQNITSFSAIPVILLGNPLSPPGINRFNIIFSKSNGEIFKRIPVEIDMNPNRGRIWFDAIHLNLFVSDNLVGTGGFSGITNSEVINSSNYDRFGTFGDYSDLNFSSSDGFDITRFLDLNERLDLTWGNFFSLRELWADPISNHGKGASLFTIFPFINLNISELLGMNISNFNTSTLVPETSFLGQTLGNYYFDSDNLTTNTINHNALQFFDALIINDPEQGFLQEEIITITEWVNNGGTLYVWAEDMYHNNLTSINSLLESFDLQLKNESFFPFQENGNYELEIEEGLFDDSTTTTISLKDPLEVYSPNQTANIWGYGNGSYEDKGVIGISTVGKGKVMVIGDNDLFKENSLYISENNIFAQNILRWGLDNYYICDITASSTDLPLYKQGFVNVNITNYAELDEKGLLDNGFLFTALFFKEDGELINASIYGMELPILPLFHTDDSYYETYFDTNWNLEIGTYYVLIVVDHPQATSELFYVKFEVFDADPPQEIIRYDIPEPIYPHYIDIIGILSIISMSLVIWYYDLEKYKTRLRITPLKGESLNLARMRLTEGTSLLRIMVRGLENGNMGDIERIRYLLSNRKRLIKFLKDLKDFGKKLGEHY